MTKEQKGTYAGRSVHYTNVHTAQLETFYELEIAMRNSRMAQPVPEFIHPKTSWRYRVFYFSRSNGSSILLKHSISQLFLPTQLTYIKINHCIFICIKHDYHLTYLIKQAACHHIAS